MKEKWPTEYVLSGTGEAPPSRNTVAEENHALHSGELMKLVWLAQNTQNPTILAELALSPEILVRKSVAQNSHTASHTLVYLSHNLEPNVRALVALNDNVELETLIRLFKREKLSIAAREKLIRKLDSFLLKLKRGAI